MKIQKNDVVKQLLSQLGYSEHDKSYQHHYAAALYVLDNFWEDKHDFTEVEEESANEFVSAFPKVRDLYDKLIEISKKKITINRIIDSSAQHTRAADLTFQAALKQFDDYLERTGVICFSDKQDFIKKEDLWRLGYSEQQLNGLKEVFKYCPLIKDDGDRYTWVYPTIATSLFALASVRDSRRDPVKDSNALVRNDTNGNAFYPAPVTPASKPKPWDVTPVSSGNTQFQAQKTGDVGQDTSKFLLGYARENSTEDGKLLEQALRSRGLDDSFFCTLSTGEGQPDEPHINLKGTQLTCKRKILCNGEWDKYRSGETSEYLLYYGERFIARTFHKKYGWTKTGSAIRGDVSVTIDREALETLPPNLQKVENVSSKENGHVSQTTGTLFHSPKKVSELSATDAVRMFLESHTQKLQSDKESFSIRRTVVKQDWNLEQILQHATSYDNRSRQVCEQLGWLDRDGTVKIDAPEIIQSTIRSFNNSPQNG